jgi:DNA-directed RNA polymerase alpha subunit
MNKYERQSLAVKRFALYEGLSVRARNCLWRAELRDKQSILKVIQENRLKKIQWVGAKIEREIMQWLEVVKIEKVCPTCGQRVIEFRTDKRDC